MDLCYINELQEEKGGFDFTNEKRNQKILGNTEFKVKKTGTTICGLVTKDAVVLGADSRATEGSIVADKFCKKLHQLADNIWTAGAGGAADLDHTCDLITSKLTLIKLNTNRQVRVSAAVSLLTQHLFRYQGHVHCALVIGGVDCQGPHVVVVSPGGSSARQPFAAMGSGSLAATAVLERGFKDNMTLEEGQFLVWSAIRAGVLNDLGSGGRVDLAVISKDGVGEYLCGFTPPGVTQDSERFRLPQPVSFPCGTTEVLITKESIREKSLYF